MIKKEGMKKEDKKDFEELNESIYRNEIQHASNGASF